MESVFKIIIFSLNNQGEKWRKNGLFEIPHNIKPNLKITIYMDICLTDFIHARPVAYLVSKYEILP